MKKNKDLFGALLFLLCIFGLTSCLNEEKEEERKVTHYEEQTVIVASKKLQGVVFSCGTDFIMDVYAVRKENSRKWEQLSHVSGFEYESGYEYKIRISKTGYLDYRMGDPAWTEHKLLEILSKEKKESEGLPESFIPKRHKHSSSVSASHAILPLAPTYSD